MNLKYGTRGEYSTSQSSPVASSPPNASSRSQAPCVILSTDLKHAVRLVSQKVRHARAGHDHTRSSSSSDSLHQPFAVPVGVGSGSSMTRRATSSPPRTLFRCVELSAFPPSLARSFPLIRRLQTADRPADHPYQGQFSPWRSWATPPHGSRDWCGRHGNSSASRCAPR